MPLSPSGVPSRAGIQAAIAEQYSPISAPTAASSSAPAAGTPIIRKLDYVSATTSSVGFVTVTFDAPFPNGILHITATTISGAPVNPVVNGGGAAISKTAAILIWVGYNNTAVTFTYEAVGW